MKIRHKLLFCTISYTFIVIITYYANKDVVDIGSKNLLNIYLYFHLYNKFGGQFTITDLLFSILPTMITASIFANSIAIDIEKNATYIFTRTEKRSFWLLKKACRVGINLLGITVLFYFIQFIFYSFMGFVVYDIREFVVKSIYTSMIIFFSNLAMVLFENALIMKWGDLWGYFISISVYCISMLSVYVVQVLKSYYYLMPLMQKYGLVYQWEEVASYFPLWDSSMSLKVVYFILPIICVAYVLVGFIMAKKVIQEKEFY